MFRFTDFAVDIRAPGRPGCRQPLYAHNTRSQTVSSAILMPGSKLADGSKREALELGFGQPRFLVKSRLV